MARRRERGALKEIKALGQKLAETYPWVDADELDHDEAFDRLVELLTDRESVSDEAFEESVQFGSKFVRAGTLAAIAAGREPPEDWLGGAEGQFEDGEWGERQLILRALARLEEDVIMKVPPAPRAARRAPGSRGR